MYTCEQVDTLVCWLDRCRIKREVLVLFGIMLSFGMLLACVILALVMPSHVWLYVGGAAPRTSPSSLCARGGAPCGSCGGGVHFLYVKLTVPRHAASATALGDALGFPLRFGHAGVILTLALTLLCWPRVDTESLGGITGAFRQPMRASAVRISSHISACTGLFLFSRLCDRCVHDLASLCPAVSASVPPSYLPV